MDPQGSSSQGRGWVTSSVKQGVHAACRLKVFGSKTVEDMLHTVKTTVPKGLTYAFNLGHVDVFPATSGKENAAMYLMERFDASPASSFLLCDDDNDLGAPLASRLGTLIMLFCGMHAGCHLSCSACLACPASTPFACKMCPAARTQALHPL